MFLRSLGVSKPVKSYFLKVNRLNKKNICLEFLEFSSEYQSYKFKYVTKASFKTIETRLCKVGIVP